tara:strand:+ start:796 stop:960 length:165 start_codon:yes stop_codon:yes gene_type:complete
MTGYLDKLAKSASLRRIYFLTYNRVFFNLEQHMQRSMTEYKPLRAMEIDFVLTQ